MGMKLPDSQTMASLTDTTRELCPKVGDGLGQAAT